MCTLIVRVKAAAFARIRTHTHSHTHTRVHAGIPRTSCCSPDAAPFPRRRVDLDQSVKVGDFGLARDIYVDDYYKTEDRSRPLPVRWMAIESIQGGKFSTKTDVVSVVVVDSWGPMDPLLLPCGTPIISGTSKVYDAEWGVSDLGSRTTFRGGKKPQKNDRTCDLPSRLLLD